MELELKNGDYIPDGAGGLRRVSGREELLQRVLFRLTARRGTFPFCPELGSSLWSLGQLPRRQWQSAAMQYVAQALAEERGLHVEAVELLPLENGMLPMRVVMDNGGEKLSVTMKIGT